MLIGLMKSASQPRSWGDWSSGCCRSAFYWFCWFAGWLTCCPPVLKSGDQVPRWVETELQAMGPLCSREKRMLGLMVAHWCCGFGGDYIDAAMVGSAWWH
ncbi:anion permease [Shigella flexneri]